MAESRSSSTSIPIVFVLWGDKFEEETASIFTTEMRRVGLRVKVVGVNGHSASGMHGLALRPDLALGDALSLAYGAACVVLPCDLDMVKRLQEDPRAMSFLAKAAESNALFIVRRPHIIEETDLAKLTFSPTNWLCYQGHDDLITFARNMANQMFNLININE